MSCSVELYHSFVDMPCWLKHWLIWIHENQTLVVGIAATVAAFLTIKDVRRQIRQQNEIAETDRLIDQNTKLRSAMLKCYQVTDGISRSLRHLKEVASANPDTPEDQLWTVHQPTVRSKSLPVRINGEELSAFVKVKESDLIMPMLELERVIEMEEDMSVRYELMRDEFENLVAANTRYEIVEGRIVGTHDFNPAENPIAMRKVAEMNNLLLMKKDLLERNYEKAILCMENLSKLSVERKLGAKFEFPKIDDLLNGE